MFTASEKKKENIAEYLLYMWQIEDIIRAYGLDTDRINENIISKYTSLPEEKRKELLDWYESLIDMMRREGVAEKGHLQINKNVLIQLRDLHARLMADPEFTTYQAEFYKTLPYIVDLRAKAGDMKADEIESCFVALYGLLLLRLQGKEVNKETLEATQQISRFLALLAKYYKEDEAGELFKDD